MAGCVEGRDWQSAAWLRCWDPTSPDIIGQTNENMEFYPRKNRNWTSKYGLNSQNWWLNFGLSLSQPWIRQHHMRYTVHDDIKRIWRIWLEWRINIPTPLGSFFLGGVKKCKLQTNRGDPPVKKCKLHFRDPLTYIFLPPPQWKNKKWGGQKM